MNWYNHLGVLLLVLICNAAVRVFSKDEAVKQYSIFDVALVGAGIFAAIEAIGWSIYLVFL